MFELRCVLHSGFQNKMIAIASKSWEKLHKWESKKFKKKNVTLQEKKKNGPRVDFFTARLVTGQNQELRIDIEAVANFVGFRANAKD